MFFVNFRPPVPRSRHPSSSTQSSEIFSPSDQQSEILVNLVRKELYKSIIEILQHGLIDGPNAGEWWRMRTERRETSDAGSQYRCGRVGRGIQPQSAPKPTPTLKHTQKVSKTLVFPLFNSITMTDGPKERRTDGRTKPLIELRVRN